MSTCNHRLIEIDYFELYNLVKCLLIDLLNHMMDKRLFLVRHWRISRHNVHITNENIEELQVDFLCKLHDNRNNSKNEMDHSRDVSGVTMKLNYMDDPCSNVHLMNLNSMMRRLNLSVTMKLFSMGSIEQIALTFVVGFEIHEELKSIDCCYYSLNVSMASIKQVEEIGMKHRRSHCMKMLLMMNRSNLNLNFRDLNKLIEVYSTLNPMLEEINRRMANFVHEDRLQCHHNDWLRDLYLYKIVERRVSETNHRDLRRQKSS